MVATEYDLLQGKHMVRLALQKRACGRVRGFVGGAAGAVAQLALDAVPAPHHCVPLPPICTHVRCCLGRWVMCSAPAPTMLSQRPVHHKRDLRPLWEFQPKVWSLRALLRPAAAKPHKAMRFRLQHV